jgi:hypothetical protein
MTYLLFPAYLLMFSFFLYVLSVKNRIRVGSRVAIAAFLCKVALGCLYGYIFLHNYDGDDTWRYHFQSLDETVLLKSDPLRFITSIFDLNNETRYSSVFESVGSYWKELEYVLLIKLIAVFNLFSGGEYYINVVWFSFLGFWGGYYFYRLFTAVFSGYERQMASVFFFFIPMVFWTSGIRKDGLVFLFMSIIFYHFYFFLKAGEWRRLAIVVLSLFMLFLVRNFLALTILPALLSWGITEKTRTSAWKIFSMVFGFCIFIFFLSARMGPVDFPQKIADRQQEFFSLQGGSEVKLDSLGKGPVSYIKILPQAVNHVFFRPYPGEQSSMLYSFSAIETWLCLLVLILVIIFPSDSLHSILRRPFIVAVLFYGLANYLLIGFTIPFLGAIVRYRIIFETLFLAVMTGCIQWKKVPLIRHILK